jgi:oligopeptide/dipeptide ABC transporter ATP-binding protein
LQEQHNISILLITHDLAVVEDMAHRVMVMYTGKIFEIASKVKLFNQPKHPYTQGLLNSIPQLGSGRKNIPNSIPGAVPDLMNLPTGCTFHPRCNIADNDCNLLFPPMIENSPNHVSACYKVLSQSKKT